MERPWEILENFEENGSLRPESFENFIGQPKVVENLRVFVEAAKLRKEALDHVLLYGPPGLGKTSLAHIIAREMNAQIICTSGPVLEKPKDLAGILTNLQEGDVLFIDEIHRLNPSIEEYLYSAMEDFKIDIVIGEGAHSRSITLNLKPFTLVGATTRAGLLTSPMLARFGIQSHMEYYSVEDLTRIVLRSAIILDVPIEETAAYEIARRSRGTPRIANRLLRRARDFAQVKGNGKITDEIACLALEALNIDEKGLDLLDKRILKTLIEKFKGGPVGIKTLAVAVGEEPDTLEEVYEPFLIMQGFLERTPRGRRATSLAYEHLNFPSGETPSLFDELL